MITTKKMSHSTYKLDEDMTANVVVEEVPEFITEKEVKNNQNKRGTKRYQ